MSVYTAPLRDMLFTMKEVGGLEAICAQPGHEETTPDLVEAILQEAAHYAAGVLDSLNRTGDVQARAGTMARSRPPMAFARPGPASARTAGLECRPPQSGAVRTAHAGVHRRAGDVEIVQPGLQPVPDAHARCRGGDCPPRQRALKQRFLEPMVAGRWTGTMNLTEPQAGSDLAALRSRAVPEGITTASAATRSSSPGASTT